MATASQDLLDRIAEAYPEVRTWELEGFSRQVLLAFYPAARTA